MDEAIQIRLDYFRSVLGDRLLAYMLGHNDLMEIKNKTFVPDSNRLCAIDKLFEEMRGLCFATDSGKLQHFVRQANREPTSSGDFLANISRPNSLANLFHDLCVYNTPKRHFADEHKLDEQCICQIARDLFPKLLTPIKGQYPYYLWANPPTDIYHEFLFLLTRDSMKLRHIFPSMKSEEKYRKLREQGVPVEDIFKDVTIFFWSIGQGGSLERFYEIPYAIISNATFQLTNNVIDDLHSFIQAVLNEYRSFVTLASQKKLKIKTFYGLKNLHVDGVKSIGQGCLRPVTDSDRLRYPMYGFGKQDYDSATAIYEIEEILPLHQLLSESGQSRSDAFWEKNREIHTTLVEKRERQFLKANKAVTLADSDCLLSQPDYNPCKTMCWFRTYQRIFSISVSPINTPTAVLSYSTHAMQTAKPVKLTDEIFTDARAYMSQLDSLTEPVIESLEIAMNRLPSAIANDDPRDAIIDGAIVWESLLGSKTIANLVDNLATAVASITGLEQDEIKRIYDTRCDIVHGNRKSKLTRETSALLYGDSQSIIKIAMDIFKFIISDNDLKVITNSDTRVKRILKRVSGE